MHTKLKGTIGELIAAEEFLRRGWVVAFPFGENQRYDLIIERDGLYKRVQVKAVYPRKGVLHINCRSSNNWSVKSYSAEDIDLIAAVDLENEEVYFIGIEQVHKALFDLRIVPTKNQQKKKVNFAKNFIEFT